MNKKIDVLQIEGGEDEYNNVFDSGNFIFLPDETVARETYGNKFQGEGEFKKWYDDKAFSYGKFATDKYYASTQDLTAINYGQDAPVVKLNTRYDIPANLKDPTFDEYANAPVYMDREGNYKPSLDINPMLPTAPYEDPIYGKIYRQYDYSNAPKDRELVSLLGGAKTYGSYFEAATKSVWNSLIPTTISGLLGSPAEVIDDIYDAYKYGYDMPGPLERFGTSMQTFAHQVTAPLTTEEQGSPWSNGKAATYNIVNGLGSIAQAVMFSKFGGNIGYGVGKLSGAKDAMAVARTGSLYSGIGIGSLVMGDAFRQESAKMGVSDTDSALLFPIIAGATALSESWFGPNIFTDAYGRSAAGSVQLKQVIADSYKKSIEVFGKSAGAKLSKDEAAILYRNIAKDITEDALYKFKHAGASVATGFIEEGSEELFEQVIQNGAKMAYDSYKANSLKPEIEGGGGLYGTQSLFEGGFDSFVLGGIAGGIAGGLMGQHRNNTMAGYWAAGQQQKVKDTVDQMHKNGLLSSPYHDINGQIIKSDADGNPLTESLNDIAYKTLQQQMSVFDQVVDTYNLKDEDTIERIAGSDEKGKGITSELFIRASKVIANQNKANELVALEKTETDPVKKKELTDQIKSLLGTGTGDGIIDYDKSRIEYLLSGKEVKDRVVNAHLFNKELLHKYGNNSAKTMRKWFSQLNDYIGSLKEQTITNAAELSAWDDVGTTGVSIQGDVFSKLKAISADSFNSDAESYFNKIRNKVMSFGADNTDKTESLNEIDRFLSAFPEVDPKGDGYTEIMFKGKPLDATSRGVYDKLTAIKQQIENYDTDYAGNTSKKKTEWTAEDEQQAIDEWIYKNVDNTKELQNADGTITPITTYQDVRELVAGLEAEKANGTLSNAENESRLNNLLNNGTGRLEELKAIRQILSEGLSDVNPDMYFEDSDHEDLSVANLPIPQKSLEDALPVLDDLIKRVEVLQGDAVVARQNRAVRQISLTRNNILNSYYFLRQISGNFGHKSVPVDLQTKWHNQLMLFSGLLNTNGLKETQDDIVSQINERDWTNIIEQFYKLADIAHDVFNTKGYPFKETLDSAFKSINPGSSSFLGGFFDPFSRIDQNEFLKYSNIKKPPVGAAEIQCYKRYFSSIITSIARMKPSLFAAEALQLLKDTTGGITPSEEQLRVIYHAMSFYKNHKEKTFEQLMMRSTGYAGARHFSDNILGIPGFAGTGKTSVVLNKFFALISQVFPADKIMTVTPNSVIDNTANVANATKTTHLDFLTRIKSPSTYGNLTSMSVIAIDEAHAFTEEDVKNLEEFTKANPDICVVVIYDNSQALNITPTGLLDLLVSKMGESTIPLTEIYRSGVIDVWKIQQYYRLKSKDSAVAVPPNTLYNIDPQNGRVGVRMSVAVETLIDDFKLAIDANNAASVDSYYLVFDDVAYRNITDPGKPLSDPKYKSKVLVIKPTETNFGVGGQTLNSVWVDGRGSSNVVFNNVMLVGVSRGVDYVHLLDPNIPETNSTAGPVAKFDASQENTPENKAALIASLSGIVSRTGATTGRAATPPPPPPPPPPSGSPPGAPPTPPGSAVVKTRQDELREKFDGKPSLVDPLYPTNVSVLLDIIVDGARNVGGTIQNKTIGKGQYTALSFHLDGKTPYYRINIDGENFYVLANQFIVLRPESEYDASRNVSTTSAQMYAKSSIMPVIGFNNPEATNDESSSPENIFRLWLMDYVVSEKIKNLKFVISKTIGKYNNVIQLRLSKDDYDNAVEAFKKSTRGVNAKALAAITDYTNLNSIGVLVLPEMILPSVRGKEIVYDYESIDLAAYSSREKYIADLTEAILKAKINKADADLILKYQLAKYDLHVYARNQLGANDEAELDFYDGGTTGILNIKGAGVKYETGKAQTFDELIKAHENAGKPFLKVGNVIQVKRETGPGVKAVVPVSYLFDFASLVYVDVTMPFIDDEYTQSLIDSTDKDRNDLLHGAFTDYMLYNYSLITQLDTANNREVLPAFSKYIQLSANGIPVAIDYNNSVPLTPAQVKANIDGFFLALKKTKIKTYQSFITGKNKAIHVPAGYTTNAVQITFPVLYPKVDPTKFSATKTPPTSSPTKPVVNKASFRMYSNESTSEKTIASHEVLKQLAKIFGDDIIYGNAKKGIIGRVLFSNLLLHNTTGERVHGVVEGGMIKLEELINGVKSKTPRHEAVHFVFRELLTEEQAQELYDEARLKMGNANATETEAEEYIADLFMNKKAYKGAKGVLNKFVDWVKRLVNKWFANSDRINDLFFKMNTGYFIDQNYSDTPYEYLDEEGKAMASYRKADKRGKSLELDEESEDIDYSDYDYLFKIFGHDMVFLNKIRKTVINDLKNFTGYNKNPFYPSNDFLDGVRQLLDSYKDIRRDIRNNHFEPITINGQTYEYNNIPAELLNHSDMPAGMRSDYIYYQLADHNIFYRFLKKSWPSIDFVKLSFYDPQDITDGFNEDPFGEESVQQVNTQVDPHRSISDFVLWFISSLNKKTMNGTAEDAVNMALLNSKLTTAAMLIKTKSSKGYDFHKEFGNEIKRIIDNIDDDTNVTNNLRAVYDAIYKVDKDISDAFDIMSKTVNPKTGFFGPDAVTIFDQIIESANGIDRPGPITLDKVIEAFGTFWVAEMSQYQFASAHNIQTAFEHLLKYYAQVNYTTESPVELEDRLQEHYLKSDTFNKNTVDKQKKSFELLSSIRTHYGSLVDIVYVKYVGRKTKAGTTFNLVVPSSSTQDDIKNEFVSLIKTVFLNTLDNVNININDNKAKALTFNHSKERYRVTESGIDLIDRSSNTGTEIIKFRKNKDQFDFVFHPEFLALHDKIDQSQILSEMLRFFGVRVNKATISAFMNDKKEVFEGVDKEYKTSTPSKLLAEAISLMFISAKSMMDLNPDNNANEPTNPWHKIIEEQRNRIKFNTETDTYSNTEELDKSEGESEDSGEIVVPKREYGKVYNPSDFYWHLQLLAKAESFSRNHGYRKKYYNVMNKVQYTQIYSSPFHTVIGHNLEGQGDVLGHKFFSENPTENHPMVMVDSGNIIPVIPLLNVDRPETFVSEAMNHRNKVTLDIELVGYIDGAEDIKGKKQANLSERDTIKTSVDSFIASVVSNERRSKSAGFSYWMPWHSISDKPQMDTIKWNTGNYNPYTFSKGKWSLNKEWIVDNANNLFKYHSNLRREAYNDWFEVLDILSPGVFTNEQKADIIKKSETDPFKFTTMLKTRLDIANKDYGAREVTKIVRQKLENNYHYKEKNGVLDVFNPGFLGLLTNKDGVLYNGSMYGSKNMNQYKKVKGTTESRYEWLITNVYSGMLKDWNKYINDNIEYEKGQPKVFTTTAGSTKNTTETIGSENSKQVNVNAFIDGFALLFHFNDFYLSSVILGKPGEFKDMADYFKRSQAPLAPGTVVDNSNPNGIGKTMNVAMVDFEDKLTMPQLKTVHGDLYKDLTDDRFNGVGFLNIFTHEFLMQSAGPGSTIISKSGMLKPVYHKMDIMENRGTYLKYALWVPSETVYDNSSFVRDMMQRQLDHDVDEYNYWRIWKDAYSRYKTLKSSDNTIDAWKSSISEVADVIKANHHTTRLIDQVVDLSVVKQGVFGVNMWKDGAGTGGNRLVTTPIDTNHLSFQLNAEKKTQDESMHIFSQIIAEMAIMPNNLERSESMSNDMAMIVNTTVDKIRTRIQEIKNKGNLSIRDASIKFLRELGMDHAAAANDSGFLMSLISDKNVNPEIGFLKYQIVQFLVNQVNSAIKPQFAGIRSNQMADLFDVYEDKNGNTILKSDYDKLSDVQKAALGVTFRQGGLSHYRFYDSTGTEVFDTALKSTITTIRPAEIVIPFTQLDKFGINEENTLSDYTIMPDGANINDWKPIDKNYPMGVRFLQWFKSNPNTDIKSLSAYQAIHNAKMKKIEELILKKIALEDLTHRTDAQVSQIVNINKRLSVFPIEFYEAFLERERMLYSGAVDPVRLDALNSFLDSDNIFNIQISDIVGWYNALEKTMTVLAGRVPAPNTSSAFVGRVVGWVNDSANTVYIPTSNNLLNNADFDIDQLSIYIIDDDIDADQESSSRNVIKAAKNNILNSALDYYSDIQNLELMMMPLQLDDMKVMLDKKDKYLKSNTKSPYTATSSFVSRNLAQQGKSAISIFANSIKAYSILYSAYLKDPSAFGTDFKIKKSGLDKNHHYIIEFMGKLVQAATDNAKLMLLGRWGANKTNANVIAVLAIQGYSPEQVIDWMSDYNIRNYYKMILNDDTVSSAVPDKIKIMQSLIEYNEEQYKLLYDKNREILGNLSREADKVGSFYSVDVNKQENGSVIVNNIRVDVTRGIDGKYRRKDIILDSLSSSIDTADNIEFDDEAGLSSDAFKEPYTGPKKEENKEFIAKLKDVSAVEITDIEEFLNNVSPYQKGDSYGVPIQKARAIIAYTGKTPGTANISVTMPGLLDTLYKSENLFRLAMTIGSNQGLQVFEYELFQYIKNTEFYVGMGLSDLLNDVKKYQGWKDMRNTFLVGEKRDEWLDKEQKIRASFNMAKVVRSNTYYMSIINAADFLDNIMTTTWSASHPKVMKSAESFFASINKDAFQYKNTYVDFNINLEKFNIALFFDQKKKDLFYIDNTAFDLADPSGRNLFVKQVPIWFQKWKEDYILKLESEGKKVPDVIHQLGVIPRADANYGNYVGLKADYDNTDLIENFRSDFNAIEDPVFKNTLYLYHLAQKGMNVKKGTMVQLFDNNLFYEYSAFLNEIHDSLDNDTPFTLRNNTVRTYEQLLNTVFLRTLAATQQSLLDTRSRALKTAGAAHENALPTDTKNMPLFFKYKRSFRSTDAVISTVYEYDADTQSYYPIESLYSPGYNQYDPTADNVVRLAPNLDEAGRNDVVGIIKFLNAEQLEMLSKVGFVSVPFILKARVTNGLNYVNGNLVEVHKHQRVIDIKNSSEIPNVLSVPIPGTKQNRIGIAKAELFVRQLQKAFPGIKVKWFSTIDAKALNVPSTTKGFVHEGVVYLNQDRMTTDTPMHEFGHIISMILKQVNPALYDALLQSIGDNQAKITELLYTMNEYKNLSEDEMKDEVFNYLLGMKSVEMLNDGILSYPEKMSLFEKIKQLIKAIYSDILSAFGVNIGFKNTSWTAKLAEREDFSTLTMDDFLNAIVRDAFSNKTVSFFNSKDLQDINQIKKLSAKINITIKNATDLKNVLLDLTPQNDADKLVSEIVNYITSNLVPKTDGRYEYTLQSGSRDVIYLESSNLENEVRYKIVNKMDILDISPNELITNWVITGDTTIAPFFGDFSNELKERIEYNQYTDEIFQAGSELFNQYCLKNGMDELANKFTGVLKGRLPIIVFHGAKLDEGAKEFSLIDLSNFTIGTNDENNILNSLAENRQASSLGIKMKLNKGSVYGLNLGMIAMEIKKIKPDMAPRNVQVIGRGRGGMVSIAFPMTDLAVQMKNIGNVPEFIAILPPEMVGYFNNAEMLSPDIWDSNYVSALRTLYMGQLSEYLGNEAKSNTEGENKPDGFDSMLIQTITRTVSPLTDYLNGKDTVDEMISMFQRRIKAIIINAKKMQTDYTKDKEYTYLSQALKELGTRNTVGRNSVSKQLNFIALEIKGNHNANNDVVQWIYREVVTGIRWIVNQYNSWNKDHRAQVKKVYDTYNSMQPENMLLSYLSDNAHLVFKRLVRFEKMMDENGVEQTVNTGRFHYDINDPLTAEEIRLKKLTVEDLEYGKFMNNHIRKVLVHNYLKDNDIDFFSNPKFEETKVYKDALVSISYQWEPGMLPLMRSSVTNKLFSKGVTAAANAWLNDVTNSDAIFDFLGQDEKNDLAVADRFYGCFNPDLRNKMLGFKTDPVSNKPIVDDLAKNEDVDYNFERVMDYFTLSSIRKGKMNTDVLPKMNAAKQILLSYNHNQYTEGKKHHENWIRFLDLMSERLIYGKRNNLEASVKLGGVKLSVIKTITVIKTATTWAGISFSIPLAINSFSANLMQLVTNSLANGITSKKLFTVADAGAAISMIFDSEYSKVIGKIVEKFQLVNMDESTILHDPRFKETDKFIFQTRWMYWMNYQTDYAARAVVAIAQMIHDGSFKAYSVDDNGELVYTESKDKQMTGPGGTLRKETITRSLIEDGFIKKGDPLPYGYDWREISALKTYSDKYIIGGVDSTTYRNMGYGIIGGLFTQFRSYLFDKLENLYAESYRSETMGSYKTVKTKDGLEEMIWQKELIEGKLQSLIATVQATKNFASMGFSAYSNLEDSQKRNLVKLSADLILWSSLYLVVSAALSGADDKDEEYGDFDNFTKQGSGSIKRLIQYTIEDLVTEFESYRFIKNPIPIANLIYRLGNLLVAVVSLDMEKAGNNLKKVSPGGATYTFITDIFTEPKTDNK